MLVLAKITALLACSQMLTKTIRYPYDLWSRNWLLWLIEIIDCWFRIMVAIVRKPNEYQDWRLLGSKNGSVSEIDHPEHLPPGGGRGYPIYPWVGEAAWPFISWPWQKIADFPTLFKTKFRLMIPCLLQTFASVLQKNFQKSLYVHCF